MERQRRYTLYMRRGEDCVVLAQFVARGRLKAERKATRLALKRNFIRVCFAMGEDITLAETPRLKNTLTLQHLYLSELREAA